MPPDPNGGASEHVRDAGCCGSPVKSVKQIPIPFTAATNKCNNTSSNLHHTSKIVTATTVNADDDLDEAGISPPPPYTTIYPPSPPSSAPSSPASGPVSATDSTAPTVDFLTPPTSSQGVASHSVLSTVFPESSPVHSMTSKSIDLSLLVPSWKGALLEDSIDSRKTLYIVGGHYDEVNLRDAVCGVLEKAEDELSADAVVIVLEKNQAELSDLLHSLMYVGGTIVNQPQLSPNPAYLLVGLDV